MAVHVIMPKLGMAMKEGRVVKWLYAEGDQVEEGEVLAEIQTEKITYQIEAPISGILAKILVTPGKVAPVGHVIGIMIEEGEVFDASTIGAIGLGAPVPQEDRASPDMTPAEGRPASSEEPRIKITPIARKMAKEKGIDITQLRGTGPDGRITRDDVLAAVGAGKTRKEPGKLSPGEVPIKLGATVPLTRIREIIGDRLTASSRDVPHVYFSCEVDGTHMIDFRKRFSERIESATGVRLSFNDIILMATARTIEQYPLFNASLEGKEIRVHEEVNIGLAVALEEGLIVPVIRRVNGMTLGEIAKARQELLDKARGKKLTLDDLSGGTFTLSNLGQYNIDFFTSIINPPEAAILSVARMRERPVVIEGKLAIRHTFNVGLSADHRVVDGAMAASFLQDLRRLLEDPYGMFQI